MIYRSATFIIIITVLSSDGPIIKFILRHYKLIAY